jgi:hypothetical protein
MRASSPLCVPVVVGWELRGPDAQGPSSFNLYWLDLSKSIQYLHLRCCCCRIAASLACSQAPKSIKQGPPHTLRGVLASPIAVCEAMRLTDFTWACGCSARMHTVSTACILLVLHAVLDGNVVAFDHLLAHLEQLLSPRW